NHSFSLGSFSDPGSDSPWAVSVDWGDGSPSTSFQITGSGPAVGTSLGSQSHSYLQDGSYTVTVTVTDKNSGSGQATFHVTVNNVAPIVTLSGPASTTEGATESYSYTFTDTGADTWTHTASCAHGVVSADTFDSTTKSGSFKCTWADNYLA